MPLVTITTVPDWSPKIDPELGRRHPRGVMVYELIKALPDMLSKKAVLMKVDPFPPAVVQVKHELFDPLTDINHPDIWILVHVGEEMGGEKLGDAESVILDAIKAWSQDCFDSHADAWFRRNGPSIVVEAMEGLLRGHWFKGGKLESEW